MGFRAYGVFIAVEPVVEDSGLIQLSEDTQDNRSVFRVTSVGDKVEGVKVGDCVYALRTSLFADKGTGVKVRVCHMSEIIAVAEGGEIGAAPVVNSGDPSLN